MEGRARGGGRRSERGRSDVVARVLAAIPAIAFAIFIVSQGGIVFALGVIALGILAQTELYTMMARVRPANLAGFLTLIGLVLAALYGEPRHVLLVLACSVPLTFFLSLARPTRENVSWAMAVTFLGIVWIGLAVAHAVLLRKLDHGGGLVLDVLIGTFVGDTAAYFGGRAWGRTRMAPLISPNKTLEGLITGIVGGTLAFWLFAVAYQHDWFKGPDALIIGFCIALAAPVGDLFESLIKRDLDVKDSGRFFGAHGGVLDRLDAVLFTLVTGYYVSRAVLG
ncbi:MAG: phosphatidate cytidylyltransferase [Thermoleophilaceae bacterium]|nr:phosphatidate cytidylyltransferase [Thermoleophilaceae bacterium]